MPRAKAGSTRTRKSLTINQKLEMIQLSEKGMSNTAIARRLGLARQTVSSVVTAKERILQGLEAAVPLKTKVTKRRSLLVDMEDVLVQWIEEHTSHNASLPRRLIQRKALILYKTMRAERGEEAQGGKFEASRGWFKRFTERGRLHEVKGKSKGIKYFKYPGCVPPPVFVSCGVETESSSVPQRAAPRRLSVELETLRDADMNVRQLIGEVEQRRPLWDRAHELRHERALIEALWAEIAIVLGQSAKNVKGKWKTLKDTYRKEAKKHVNDPSYESPWANYELLSFLYPQLGLENNADIIDQNSSNSFAEQESKIEFVYEHCGLPIANGDGVNATSTGRGVKRKIEEDEGDCKDSLKKEEDEDLCFFRSLIPHLKQLSPQRKMLMRIKMQEMVYKEVYSPNF